MFMVCLISLLLVLRLSIDVVLCCVVLCCVGSIVLDGHDWYGMVLMRWRRGHQLAWELDGRFVKYCAWSIDEEERRGEREGSGKMTAVGYW